MAAHPGLGPLNALVGTWRGRGHGQYPTIDDFGYTEEITFTATGKPFLAYAQRTWADDGQPLHVETGYLRLSGNAVEFVLAQPTGQTELAEGQLTVEENGDLSMELSSQVVNAATAKSVDTTIRRLHLNGDSLVTSFDMAAVGVGLARHLTSALERVRTAAGA